MVQWNFNKIFFKENSEMFSFELVKKINVYIIYDNSAITPLPLIKKKVYKTEACFYCFDIGFKGLKLDYNIFIKLSKDINVPISFIPIYPKYKWIIHEPYFDSPFRYLSFWYNKTDFWVHYDSEFLSSKQIRIFIIKPIELYG